MIFNKIETLGNLEKDNNFRAAIDLLKKNWIKDPYNPESFIRLISECWYILSEWEFLNILNSNINKKDLKQQLVEGFDFAVENFSKNSKVLAILGYMITITPFNFYEVEDEAGEKYEEYEIIGKKMISTAREIDPNNKFIGFIYIGSTSYKEEELQQYKEYFRKNVKNHISGDTYVEQYFSEILTR